MEPIKIHVPQITMKNIIYYITSCILAMIEIEYKLQKQPRLLWCNASNSILLLFVYSLKFY